MKIIGRWIIYEWGGGYLVLEIRGKQRLEFGPIDYKSLIGKPF